MNCNVKICKLLLNSCHIQHQFRKLQVFANTFKKKIPPPRFEVMKMLNDHVHL
jgi:hypothetical protein